MLSAGGHGLITPDRRRRQTFCAGYDSEEAVQARSLMIETKRSNRDGLIISALCHVGIIGAVLILAWAASQKSTPQETVPPDTMQVEFVAPKDIPHYSGTPSTLRTSGTQQMAESQALTAKSEQPPTVPSPPQPKDQSQSQHNAQPKPQESQTTPPQTKAPPLPQVSAAKVAMAQPEPDPPAPSAEETPDAPDTAAKAAFLALAGGRFGGGFAAPPINSPLVGYDFTEPFRELLSTCGALPSGISPTEKISITVRVFLNHDGTVAEAPELLDANPSTEQQTLMQNFVSGLQKCQPYTMLPQEQYSQWKTLDLVVHPHNYLAQ